MRIGDGVEPTKPNDMVRIPHQIALPWAGEQSIQTLIDHIFPQLDCMDGMHHIWSKEP